MPLTWTPSIVEHRLQEARRTIRRLPTNRWDRLSGLKTSWPDYPADWGDYGAEAAREGRTLPTPPEIDRMDECIAWMGDFLSLKRAAAAGLPEDAARIVWLRVGGNSMERISYKRERVYGPRRAGGGKSPIPGGNSRQSLYKTLKAALKHIADELNRKGVPCRPVPGTVDDLEPLPSHFEERRARTVVRVNLDPRDASATAHHIEVSAGRRRR